MPRGKKNPAPLPATPTASVATPPPPAPLAPSPAVLELQSDIVTLARERSTYRKLVGDAQSELFAAQANFQATQARLSMFEQEINERMNIIAQLENRAPMTPIIQFPAPGEYPIQPNLSGISSEPTRTQQTDLDMVNRGHAVRAAL
jgi:hypothetical protein